MRPGTAILAASAALIAACSQTDEGNQAGDEPARETTSREVSSAASTGPSGNAGAGEDGTKAVSSGMPVPGTNTPEHIVVNETPRNSD